MRVGRTDRKWLCCLWVGGLLGLAACAGCGTKTPPGSEDYKKGCEQLSINKLPEAISAFDRATKRNPQFALAVLQRAVAYEKQGNIHSAIDGYSEAISVHEKIIATPVDQADGNAVPLSEDLAVAYCHRGNLRLKQGNHDAAIEDFNKAIALNPRYADACCGRGTAFSAKGIPDVAVDDLTEAVRLLTKSDSSVPDVERTSSVIPDEACHEVYCQRAYAYLAAGRPREAIEDCRLAIRFGPRCGKAFYTLGEALLSSTEAAAPAQTVACLEEAIRWDKSLFDQVNPDLAQAYFNLGIYLDKAGKKLKAGDAFSRAEKIDHKYVQLRLEYQGKSKQEGLAPPTIVEKPVGIDPLLARLSRDPTASLERHTLDKALANYSNSLKANPKNVYAWYGQGCMFLQKGFAEMAIDDFDRVISLHANFANMADVYCQRGRAFVMMGNYSQAARDCMQAIRLKPEFPVAYYYQGIAHLKDGNFDRAVADLAEAVALDPKLESPSRPLQAEIFRERGLAHFAARQWDATIADLRNAVRREPKWARSLGVELATAYRWRGSDQTNHAEFDEALRDFGEAIRFEPMNAANYRLRGDTYYRMERWERAAADFNKAIALDPDLEYSLRRPLATAQRRIAAASVPAIGVGRQSEL